MLLFFFHNYISCFWYLISLVHNWCSALMCGLNCLCLCVVNCSRRCEPALLKPWVDSMWLEPCATIDVLTTSARLRSFSGQISFLLHCVSVDCKCRIQNFIQMLKSDNSVIVDCWDLGFLCCISCGQLERMHFCHIFSHKHKMWRLKLSDIVFCLHLQCNCNFLVKLNLIITAR